MSKSQTMVMSLVLLPAIAGCRTASIESPNDNDLVVARFYEAINRGDAHEAAAEFAEDATNFGRTVGRKGIEDRLNDIFTTFPDWRMEVLETSSSNEIVVVRCSVSGTHLGVGTMPLNGMPVGVAPTGKRFEVTHMHWHKMRDGKIVEHYANRDDLNMLRQLGLLPPISN